MKCAHCGQLFSSDPVCGICCSNECSRLFGESLTPPPVIQEQRDPVECFFRFCLSLGVDLRELKIFGGPNE